MTFQENLANYSLGNYSVSKLPEIALEAIKEGNESDSLLILAGMSRDDNSFQILEYFQRSLKELNIEMLDKMKSAEILLLFYLKKMIDSNPQDRIEIMTIIKNHIYDKIKCDEDLAKIEESYVGEILGLEKMFTWYKELQDFFDGSRILYYNDLSKGKQREKLENHLLEEAKELYCQIK